MEHYGMAHKPHGKNHNLKFGVVTVFVFIMLFIIMTSFSDSFPMTGNILTGSIIGQGLDEETLEEGIEFQAELTIPEMSLDGDLGAVQIVGNSNSFIRIGRQNFDLSELNNNFIVLHDFNGKISFDNSQISSLDGRASGVTINGVSNTNSNKVTLSNFNYESLHFGKKIPIKEISYTTSGHVSLNNGKENFNINEDSIRISEFYGNVSIENDEFVSKGHVKRIVISGDTNIDIRK